MKVLNLYAGIGGNRKLWRDVEVVAVESNPEIAAIYQDFFPNDTVIIGDAHEYLLHNYKQFDFIWSSTPCPTHSRARFWGDSYFDYTKQYPDMSLYQEIIFLKHYAKDKLWNVENVIPYYEPLIPAQKIDRHLFWSNFYIKPFSTNKNFEKDSLESLEKLHGISLSKFKIADKVKLLRNCVNPALGRHILECALNQPQRLFGPVTTRQESLFL